MLDGVWRGDVACHMVFIAVLPVVAPSFGRRFVLTAQLARGILSRAYDYLAWWRLICVRARMPETPCVEMRKSIARIESVRRL